MKNLICIACPIGCHLTIDASLNVKGNRCPRGVKYAIEEMTHPTRILTSTVRTQNLNHPRLSIKSDKPLPKELIFDTLHLLNEIIIENNVKIGDVLIHNVLNTGVNIIATQSIVIASTH